MITHHLLGYYAALHYWDFASEEAIKRMQLRKFSELFEYAKVNSPFYRDFYKKHGVSTLKIRSYDDIKKVPIVNKKIMRQHALRDIVTREIDSTLKVRSTSGSTGEPFKIAYSNEHYYTAHCRLLKVLLSSGYRPFQKLLDIRADPNHPFEEKKDLGLLHFARRSFKLFRTELVLISESADAMIAKINQFKPDVVWSTPSIVQLISYRLRERNEKLSIPLALIMSETINPTQEKLFKEFFCQNYIDLYGSVEILSMGFSFNTSARKNIFVNTALVETTTEQTNSNLRNLGRLIATNLINKTMPFIRYDTGDHVEIASGDIDFPKSSIGRIYGRADDILRFGQHTLTYHQSYQLFSDFHECEQYKFTQKEDGEIILQLKLRKGTQEINATDKAQLIWQSAYAGQPIQVEIVDHLPVNLVSGKFKVIEKLV